MKSPAMHCRLLASSLVIASTALAGPEKNPAKDAAAIEPLHPMYLGSLNTGLKVNDAYTEGNFSIVAPVWSSLGADAILDGGVFYIEPYISWGEQGEVASSLGLGYRHLIGRQPLKALTQHDGHQASFLEEGVVLGGNLFLDMLDTETNHQFWQLGVGAEVLTRYVELRGNYYIPLTDRKEVGSFRTQQTQQSTSQQTSTVGADPYATGNSILQPYTQVTTQTTTTTTIERLFRLYEEGMEGWDFEIGILLPWVDRCMDAKVIAGYYAFDNQPFGPQTGGAGNVEGWKAGLELRPVPALVLNGTWYEDERLTGADWTASVRLEIPFEGGELGDGKTFWSRIGDSFKPRRRHLAERMAEPVRRQNAAVKLAKSTQEDRDEKQTSVKKVTKVVSQSQGQLVLADDVVFVNNGPAVGNGIQAGSPGPVGTGTAERPFDTIQEGAALAGANSSGTRVWSVYTQGVATSYTGDVTLTGSTNFIGSGKTIAGLSGRSFGSGPAPTLAGGIEALGVGALGVTGYVITTGHSVSGDAIHAEDVATLRLVDNAFHDAVGESVDIVNTGTNSSILISGNFFNRSGVNAIALDSDGASVVGATISGNSFLQSGDDDIQVTSDGTSQFTLVATRNVLTAGGDDGFDVLSLGASMLNFTATRNSLANLAEDGFVITSDEDSILSAVISRNAVADVGLGGVLAEADEDSTMNLTVSQNTIARVGAAGVDVSTLFGDGAELNVTVAGNDISFTTGPGVALGNLSNLSMMNLSVTGNRIFGVLLLDGIYVQTADGTTTMGAISGNSIEATESYGVHVDAELASDVTLAINSNTISFTTAAGIGLHSFDSATLTVTSLAGNSINLADFHGMQIFTDDATAILDISGFNSNTITNSTDDGINLDAFAGSVLNVNGTLNNAVGPHPGGERLESIGAPAGTVRINGALIVLPLNVP